MPRQIFKNKSIAIAGPLPGQLTTENLERWTTIRKGNFSNDFDEDVTHLLCTREQFNKRVPRVKDALKRGKRLHILHYDWFEFSIFQEKSQPEREYSMRNLLAKHNAAKREEARIEKGKRDGEKFVNTNLFHIYTDREFFQYQIELNRDDPESGELGQKYTLCLWESDAKPHLYWFTAKFLRRKGNSQPSYHRVSPHSGKWRVEMNYFMEFFRIKTGIEWEDRVTKMSTMPSSYFQYAPPVRGKPVGRRLRFDYDYCRQVNAEMRGLPWPPVREASPAEGGVTRNFPIASKERIEVAITETMNDSTGSGNHLLGETHSISQDISDASATMSPPTLRGQNSSPGQSSCTSFEGSQPETDLQLSSPNSISDVKHVEE
ncbi:hypothetical protein BGZ63DRAFT_446774 [Mariannaea sp. PMI_226]|nr:hypothetical protein BGZ63DRAFT_446774 [Mariannaea sp. PMI_226]